HDRPQAAAADEVDVGLTGEEARDPARRRRRAGALGAGVRGGHRARLRERPARAAPAVGAGSSATAVAPMGAASARRPIQRALASFGLRDSSPNRPRVKVMSRIVSTTVDRPSVKAKPRTGPTARKYSTTAA